MKKRGALAIVLYHVWFVNSYVCPSIHLKRPTARRQQRTCAFTASNVPSAATILNGSDDGLVQKQLNVTETLWTFVYNIPKASQTHATAKDRMRPVYSLVYFLQNTGCSNHDGSMDKPLERATIQAVRAASAVGDYRLVFKIVEAAVEFCPKQVALPPRLFGEAIESLSKTQCNVSKLKQMWKLSKTFSKVGAFELNVMLKALAKRGKIRAALDLYASEKDSIETDAYTTSTLLTALTSSIRENQTPVDNVVSPCWQYVEGWQLLKRESSRHELNNYVFAAALRLNERAGQVFSVPRHYTAKCALNLLQFMKKLEISPDVVTCSLVASAFDKAHESKAAVSLLNAMTASTISKSNWTLAAPNEYIYCSVISACAQCNEYDAALQVLERMRRDDSCDLNTWVYNAALKACIGGRCSSRRKQRVQQSQMALTLLEEMQQDYRRGLDTAPDTISYNTALAAISGMSVATERNNLGRRQFSSPVSIEVTDEWSRNDAAAFQLLEEMKENGVPRDALSYRNAIKAVGANANAVLAMVDAAIEDLGSPGATREGKKLKNREGEGMIDVFHAALAVLSRGNDFAPVASVFTKMIDSGVQPNTETTIHLLNALGSAGKSQFIPHALVGLENGDSSSLDTLKQHCDIGIQQLFPEDSKPTLELKHYSAAIKACLSANDIEQAQQVLSLMKEKNLSPDTDSLQEIALTYCRLATLASAEESKIGRRVRSKKKRNKRTLRMDVKRSVSAARARSALEITLSLENPSIHLLSTVSQACCPAGMWAQGRMMLARVHNAAVTAKQPSTSDRFRAERRNDPMFVLPGLHRSLLKLCASKGNATAALAFADDIQALSRTLATSSNDTGGSREDTLLLSSLFDNVDSCDDGDDDVDDDVAAMVSEVAGADAIQHGDTGIGMKGEDWKLVLIAASKAGHWRLCLGTLQFLKPFLEATHPSALVGSNHKHQSKNYDKLARSLTAAILCFEMRGQYAWTLRAIEDWIEWSGRRPRKEAILGAFRILASRGQGYQVNRLLKQVLDVPATSHEDGELYEEILCVGALNSLHSHGLYEDADDLYVQACTQGWLPFSIELADTPTFVLDLHGMNVAMANSAVRIALQQYALPPSSSQDGDMIIVTGRGMNSAQRLRPVLRPEVQRMLLEEFYPPLSTVSVPGNLGALRVPSQDVKEWVLQQRQQKGARMLAIAQVLKNLTSGKRIRKSIELKLQSSTEEDNAEEG